MTRVESWNSGRRYENYGDFRGSFYFRLPVLCLRALCTSLLVHSVSACRSFLCSCFVFSMVSGWYLSSSLYFLLRSILYVCALFISHSSGCYCSLSLYYRLPFFFFVCVSSCFFWLMVLGGCSFHYCFRLQFLCFLVVVVAVFIMLSSAVFVLGISFRKVPGLFPPYHSYSLFLFYIRLHICVYVYFLYCT